MRILIFGDSVAQGYYDLESGGWVNLLFVENMNHKARRTDNPREIFNMAISGDTTRRVINRLKTDVDARKWEDEPIALVFAVGVNDAMVSNGQPISSPEQYHADLEELHALAESIAQHIVFVGLESVCEAESNPWAFNSGSDAECWTNERIGQFDAVLKDFAAAKQAVFVPVFDVFSAAQAQGMLLHEDGLHPNAAGHRLIFEQVRPILDNLSA